MKTNLEAQTLITTGAVQIDGAIIFENCVVNAHSEIKVNGKIERKKKEFVYLKFNKPVGYESSLNPKIENNLSSFFENFSDLAIAGRLDKNSNGLMLLSNDGKWIENLCNPKFEKEKEYCVVVDRIIDDEFIERFISGVKIDSYITKNCICEKLNPITLRVILTEGKNRQIRKMCKTLGYNVLNLKRVRIANFSLENLEEGTFEFTKI